VNKHMVGMESTPDGLRACADLYVKDTAALQKTRGHLYRLIREARSSMSLRQIAKETGFTYQRIQQIERMGR
jgi:hypothetical protein